MSQDRRLNISFTVFEAVLNEVSEACRDDVCSETGEQLIGEPLSLRFSARSLTMPVVVKLMYALVVLGVVVQTNRLSFARLSPCFTNLMVLIIYNTYI